MNSIAVVGVVIQVLIAAAIIGIIYFFIVAIRKILK